MQPQPRAPRWLTVLRFAPLLLALAPLPLTAVVPDSGMAPTLLPGDLVLVWPASLPGSAPAEGATVALRDPLDPARWTLRRVEAAAGEAVSCEDGFLLSPSSAELIDLGRLPADPDRPDGPARVIVRANRRLLSLPNLSPTWDMPEIHVPEGWLFLSADNRAEALDSRWWGLIPAASASATVLLRVGPPQHRWRGWWEWRP